jgi:hypothetical protein
MGVKEISTELQVANLKRKKKRNNLRDIVVDVRKFLKTLGVTMLSGLLCLRIKTDV